MALRDIVLEGDKTLTKKCRPVEKFDEKLAALLDDMAETLHKADGVGLAAPQVGILRRVCIVDIGDEDGVIELVNPKIVMYSGEQEGAEGCLSCPNQYGVVVRPMHVTVKAQDRHGNEFTISGSELKARAFCHEIDHLDGIIFKKKAERMLRPDEIEPMEK
ncbi:MAG: peptide deformylase [Lachnospiraceae bacterium]|nr:peptide deformylase [Lachnospiraceae bacterium]